MTDLQTYPIAQYPISLIEAKHVAKYYIKDAYQKEVFEWLIRRVEELESLKNAR